jgi:glycosyl transferase family 25
MKAYVINLVRSTARRAHIERELDRVGLEYEIVPAVDGATLAPEHRALVDAGAVARAPDWLRPGIVGAALSHMEVYRRIAANEEGPALVLEDDASLNSETKRILAAAATEMAGAEIVLAYFRALRPCRLSRHDSVALPGGRTLMYPVDADPLTAGSAYLITPSAARRMSEFVAPVRAGPDSWAYFLEGGGIDSLRCILPRAVGVRNDFKSTVDYLGDASSRVQRVMTAVADRRIFPLYQLAGMRRRINERRMSRFSITSERSPLARGTLDGGL